MGYVCLGIGILFLLYYLSCIFYGGTGISYLWIWLVSGTVFILGGVGNLVMEHYQVEMPGILKFFLWVLVLVSLVFFLLGEAWVFSGLKQEGEANLDYIVILGCLVKGEEPSRTLRERLDTALEYLEENPATIGIVSGGQGEGELISEAQCMYDYLRYMGISTERLLMEDQSANTKENLIFSKKWIADIGASVGIVTSDFHIYRAVALARNLGYEDVCGIAAPCKTVLKPHHLVRECLAVWKEILKKNI